MRVRCAWLLVVLAAGLVCAGPAGAKDRERPSDPVAVSGSGVGIAPGAPEWVRERIAAIHAGRIEAGDSEGPATVRTPQAARRAAWFGCRDVYAYRGYNHFLGYNLFRYYQQVSWCSNGYSIYSWSRFRWAEVNFPGWGFDGHVDSNLGGSTTHKYAFTQGQFHSCYFGWCDYKTPWVLIDVYVSGDWSADAGG